MMLVAIAILVIILLIIIGIMLIYGRKKSNNNVPYEPDETSETKPLPCGYNVDVGTKWFRDNKSFLSSEYSFYSGPCYDGSIMIKKTGTGKLDYATIPDGEIVRIFADASASSPSLGEQWFAANTAWSNSDFKFLNISLESDMVQLQKIGNGGVPLGWPDLVLKNGEVLNVFANGCLKSKSIEDYFFSKNPQYDRSKTEFVSYCSYNGNVELKINGQPKPLTMGGYKS